MSLSPQQLKVASQLYGIARSAGLPPQRASEFVAAAYAESGLNPAAVNKSSGAAGEFQLLSPGYRAKAQQLGGLSDVSANARAILPDYVNYWKKNPGAEPGAAGRDVERSGEGAGFYAKGLPLLSGLAAGTHPGLPVAAADATGGSGGAGTPSSTPMGQFALQIIKQSQALEHGQSYDLSPAIAALGSGSLTATPQTVAPSEFTAGKGTVIVSPNANRAGVGLQPLTLSFIRQISHVHGAPLTIGTGTNHNEFVIGTNRESEHWTGHAADIPSTGAALTKLGQDALIAAGMAPEHARHEKGGVYNLTVAGHRVQIIFNSNVGGDHYNHLHVGVK